MQEPSISSISNRLVLAHLSAGFLCIATLNCAQEGTPPAREAAVASEVPLSHEEVDWADLKDRWHELSDDERALYRTLAQDIPTRRNISRAPADACAAATYETGALPYMAMGDTVGLTDDYNLSAEPSGCAGGGSQYGATGVGGDEAWLIQVDVACRLHVSMTSASNDMNVMALTDCADLDDSCLNVDDAAGGGGTEDIYFDVTPGVDYFIIVDGYSGGESTYDLTIEEDGTPVGCVLVAPGCDGTNDGAACTDGINCTVNDICVLGACVGTPSDAQCEDGDPCTTNTCDGVTCNSAPATGNPCDDGNACTDDICNAGICEGTNDDTNGCSDGDPCTSDTCTAGICVGSTKDCSAFDATCLVGTCNPITGFCEPRPANEAGICDDGDACTETDVCAAGVCGGALVDCSGLDNLCDVGVCNPGTGACETAPKDCSNLDGACATGVCNATTGNCEAMAVVAGTLCDDGDPCTESDACAGTSCAGTPKDCTNACNSGTCNPFTGACVLTPANQGMMCDDANPCTTSDTCNAGVCDGAAMDCSGLDGQCAVGQCDPDTTNCEATPIREGLSCDDSDLCSDSDICSDGTCVGTPRDCSTFDSQCSMGVCDALSGLCSGSALVDGMPCDDADPCTTDDACAQGVCRGTDTCVEDRIVRGSNTAGPAGENEPVGNCNQTPMGLWLSLAGLWLASPLRRRRR